MERDTSLCWAESRRRFNTSSNPMSAMPRLRLRTQLLLAALVTISAMTGAILLIVHYEVRSEITRQTKQSIETSVRAFNSLETQRDAELSRTASLLAELPPLMALMTTEHAPTIQDASEAFWKLAGSDLFLLAEPGGKVLGFHVKNAGLTTALAEQELKNSSERNAEAAWWYSNGQLYRVVYRTISTGPATSTRDLGILVVGYEVDSQVAAQLAMDSGAQIVLSTPDRVIASTLPGDEQGELKDWIGTRPTNLRSGSRELTLGTDQYEVASVLIDNESPVPIRCYVLLSLTPSNAVLADLNRTIVILGVTAVLLAMLLLGFVSGTLTRPLENLVSGVRALTKGDYTYSIEPRGSAEIAELAKAFAVMRDEVRTSNEQRIANERIMAVGRAASSISHDLRHYLAAIVANAEFLSDSHEDAATRREIYEEIITASAQMTDLLDSLRELARGERAISPNTRRSIPSSAGLRTPSGHARSGEPGMFPSRRRATWKEFSMRARWSASSST